jgi:hypothetical protein
MAKTQHGRELNGSEMSMILDEFCNGASDRARADFVEQLTTRTHRTLQQSAMGLFVKCIEAWASATNFDDRNEATVKLCKKIVDATGDKYDRCLPHV